MHTPLLITTLAITLAGTHLQAQSDNNYRQPVDRNSGSLLYLSQYESVKGSQFYNSDWLPGTVKADNGALYTGKQLKFDAMNNKFVFSSHDSLLEIVPAPKEVQLFAVDGSVDTSIFRKGFSISGKLRPTVYLQVLAEGKTTFLKHIDKGIEEYTEYGDATKYKRFTELYQYFVFSNNEYREIKLNKKGLEELLQDKWPAVSGYLSEQKLSGKDEKSWRMAIRYYNSLSA